jgi:outer membrane protein TolC
MGLPANIDFELADVESIETDVLIDCLEELEEIALHNRPELYSADIDQLIKADDVRLAILQMFPNVELFDGRYHDGNRFLLHNNWMTAGVRATWNLLDIPGHEQERYIADSREDLIRINRMAISIGIVAQLHLAYFVYYDNVQSYKLARELESINERLLVAARSEQKQGKLHEADILKYEAEFLFSQVNTKKAYGDVENALEQLNNALGRPLYYRNTVTYGVDEEDKELDEQPTQLENKTVPYYEPGAPSPAQGTQEPTLLPGSQTDPTFNSSPDSSSSSFNSLMPPPLEDNDLSPRPTLPSIDIPSAVPIQGTPAQPARPVKSGGYAY